MISPTSFGTQRLLAISRSPPRKSTLSWPSLRLISAEHPTIRLTTSWWEKGGPDHALTVMCTTSDRKFCADIRFSGPPGVGKTLTAEGLSEYLIQPLYAVGARPVQRC